MVHASLLSVCRSRRVLLAAAVFLALCGSTTGRPYVLNRVNVTHYICGKIVCDETVASKYKWTVEIWSAKRIMWQVILLPHFVPLVRSTRPKSLDELEPLNGLWCEIYGDVYYLEGSQIPIYIVPTKVTTPDCEDM